MANVSTWSGPNTVKPKLKLLQHFFNIMHSFWEAIVMVDRNYS
jgi:hypothetical protein